MRRLPLPLVLGLAHGASDGAAGLLLGTLPLSRRLAEVAALVLLYNALAFGAQPFVGALVERLQAPRAAVAGGLAAVAAALVVGPAHPWAAVALAGAGSAAFHVGGGAWVLAAGRAAPTGVFLAPGVAGLALGGWLGAGGAFPALPFVAVLAACLALLARHAAPPPAPRPRPGSAFDRHDLLMLSLLAVLALRSLVWTALQYAWAGRWGVLLALAAAAALGKAIGGVAADRLGTRRWTTLALLAATPLLLAGRSLLSALLLGTALLQSATPALLTALSRATGRPALAAALGLGLAVALGGLPFLAGLSPAALLGLPLLGVLGAAVLLVARRPRRRARAQPAAPRAP